MRLDAHGVTFRVPQDLANVLVESGLAEVTLGHRAASIPEMIEQAAVVAATVVTLVQAPVTIQQLIACVRTWMGRRRERQQHLGTLEFHLQDGGQAVVHVNDMAEVERIARGLQLLFSKPTANSDESEAWRNP